MLEHLRRLPVKQQPTWQDHPDYAPVMRDLEARDPLVELYEVKELTRQLGEVAAGDGFLLHGGSCAEMFADTRQTTQNQLKTMLSMTIILMYGAGVHVVKVGRLAGQFAKPRSADTEEVGGLVLPSYRGDMVNDAEATTEARRHDPKRMLTAYDHSNTTMRTLERLSRGGFADIEQMHAWNVAFAENSEQSARYTETTDQIGNAISFLKASGVRPEDLQTLHKADVFSSHEALIQDYELALTRQEDNQVFASSAHMLWIGVRTGQLDEFHVAYCASIANPVAAKIGPAATPDEVLALCEALNPDRIPGRLSLITRMGRDAVGSVLPPILERVEREGHSVVWVSDPMHGNTRTHTDGKKKTRLLADITAELANTADVHAAQGTWFGGVSLEMTGENVTECMGGSGPNMVGDLERAFQTSCDPRLNGEQAVELAFAICELKAKYNKSRTLTSFSKHDMVDL